MEAGVAEAGIAEAGIAAEVITTELEGMADVACILVEAFISISAAIDRATTDEGIGDAI